MVEETLLSELEGSEGTSREGEEERLFRLLIGRRGLRSRRLRRLAIASMLGGEGEGEEGEGEEEEEERLIRFLLGRRGMRRRRLRRLAIASMLGEQAA